MIEGIRVLKLGPWPTRMDHHTCTYNAVITEVRFDAPVGTVLRVLDYPVNLSVRGLTTFLTFRKRSFTEADKVNIGRIFIIEGLFTIFISFFVWLIVPDFPEKATFLTDDERRCLLEKLHEDKGDQKLDLRSIPWFEILVDYRIWFP